MRLECVELLVENNREIEFEYQDKKYSITYYNDNRERFISFCEFYQTPTDVKNVQELLNIKIGDKTLQKVLSELEDSAFDIY